MPRELTRLLLVHPSQTQNVQLAQHAPQEHFNQLNVQVSLIQCAKHAQNAPLAQHLRQRPAPNQRIQFAQLVRLAVPGNIKPRFALQQLTQNAEHAQLARLVNTKQPNARLWLTPHALVVQSALLDFSSCHHALPRLTLSARLAQFVLQAHTPAILALKRKTRFVCLAVFVEKVPIRVRHAPLWLIQCARLVLLATPEHMHRRSARLLSTLCARVARPVLLEHTRSANAHLILIQCVLHAQNAQPISTASQIVPPSRIPFARHAQHATLGSTNPNHAASPGTRNAKLALSALVDPTSQGNALCLQTPSAPHAHRAARIISRELIALQMPILSVQPVLHALMALTKPLHAQRQLTQFVKNAHHATWDSTDLRLVPELWIRNALVAQFVLLEHLNKPLAQQSQIQCAQLARLVSLDSTRAKVAPPLQTPSALAARLPAERVHTELLLVRRPRTCNAHVAQHVHQEPMLQRHARRSPTQYALHSSARENH